MSKTSHNKRKETNTLLSAAVVMAATCAGLVYAGNSVPVSGIIKTHAAENVCRGKWFPKGADRTSDATGAKKAPAVTVNSTVKTETIIDEDFSKWTKGTQEQPYSEQVTEEMVAQLMTYPGDWSLFDMYEAGGAGYMGFDEVSDNGPGYIKNPGIDLKGEDKAGIYRFTARVKNVNPNSQDQGLQAFIMDEAESKIISASTLPMKYNEWCECEWIGSTSSPSTSFMAFGWSGKVLIDRFKVEKLIYPLATPEVTSAAITSDGTMRVEWNKVEGATSYKVVISGDDSETTSEAGDVQSCNVTIPAINPDETYIAYVTALDGDKLSYPGYLVCDITPGYVGNTVALNATEVNKEGFTANWEDADYASRYLIMPVVTHTATQNETFQILDEKFTNVPETADSFHPIMISPLLGMGGADIYWSRAGWEFDLAILAQMMPGMPVMVLSNEYAPYGIVGSITSPVTDFSVGGGKVTVSGSGASAADDAVMECSLIDAEGNVYANSSFELTTDLSEFSVEIEGGKADSRLRISIGETAGDEQIMFTALNVSTGLAAGETITVPAPTVRVDSRTTSGRVECTVDDNNCYSYKVQGYWSANLMGEISNSITVKSPSAVGAVSADCLAHAAVSADGISIINPAGENCTVCTLDGKVVYNSNVTEANVALVNGVYIVRIGQQTFKISKQ